MPDASLGSCLHAPLHVTVCPACAGLAARFTVALGLYVPAHVAPHEIRAGKLKTVPAAAPAPLLVTVSL